MLTENDILEIINQKIHSDEELGEQAGGSGHLGFVSYSIDDYTVTRISSELIEIKFKYTLITETEFTYYPDNPPHASHIEKKIFVNDKKEIISSD